LDDIGPHADLLKSLEVYAHNQTAKLINSGNYQLALDYIEQALRMIPESALLKRDRSLVESKTR
jgi:tetratricopeptide (TPR) repeat protein